MRDDVAIVFPINVVDINEVGIIALKQAKKVLKKYDMYYVVPKTLPKQYIELLQKFQGDIIRVDEKYYGSTEAHNNLLESREFYLLFERYNYIMIHHMDAFVFEDKIDEFVKKDFDYIGAPWDKGEIYQGKRYYVGNGGLSLRKVSSFLKHIGKLQELHKTTGLNEDFCVAVLGDTLMNVADIDSARRFSFELNVNLNYIENGNQLPMGCHAWNKTQPDFWKPFIESCGYKVPDSVFDGGKMCFLDNKCTGVKDYDIFKQIITEFLNGDSLWLWGCGYYGRLLFAAFYNVGIQFEGAIDGSKDGNIASVRIVKPEEVDYCNKPKIFVAVKGDTSEIEKYLVERGYLHRQDYLLLRDVV